MQNPIGSEFNYETMRMEITNFAEVIFNPAAQVKFVHTVAAGYTTGSAFVLGIGAYYMLKGRDIPLPNAPLPLPQDRSGGVAVGDRARRRKWLYRR